MVDILLLYNVIEASISQMQIWMETFFFADWQDVVIL